VAWCAQHQRVRHANMPEWPYYPRCQKQAHAHAHCTSLGGAVPILDVSDGEHTHLSDWQQLSTSDLDGPDDSNTDAIVLYSIAVSTGSMVGANTTANVWIKMESAEGLSTGRMALDMSDCAHKFARGQTDTFELKCCDIGDVAKVSIGHDDSGSSAGWFLLSITVTHSDTKRSWRFNCGRWLDVFEDDGNIERELELGAPASHSEEEAKRLAHAADSAEQQTPAAAKMQQTPASKPIAAKVQQNKRAAAKLQPRRPAVGMSQQTKPAAGKAQLAQIAKPKSARAKKA